MILEALTKAGGVDYLVKQAEKNPATFCTLIGKVLPLQVKGDLNHSLTLEQLVNGSFAKTPA